MFSEDTTDTTSQPIAQETEKKTRRKTTKQKPEDKKMVRPTFYEESLELLDYLRGPVSRADYLHKLLLEEKNRETKSSQLPTVPEIGVEAETWFTTSKEDTRIEVKEALGIEGEDIVMTEAELLAKASELSGIPVPEIQKQGRQTLGQKLITQFCKPRQGQGQAGGADSRLDESLKSVQEMIENGSFKGKLTLTAVSQRAMANYNTAKGWAVRRGYQDLFGLK